MITDNNNNSQLSHYMQHQTFHVCDKDDLKKKQMIAMQLQTAVVGKIARKRYQRGEWRNEKKREINGAN